jgi:hypothetical protein
MNLDIEFVRDLILSIQGVVFIVLMLVITVLILVLFRKAKKMLDAVDTVTGKVQKASSSVNEEVVKAALQMVTLIQGARTIREAFKKK